MLDRWDGRTVVCIASGPSLAPEDCELVRRAGHPTIVANTTFRLCPWADVLFGFDTKWWRVYHEEVKATFRGRRVAGSDVARKYGAEVCMRRYRNSGACAAAIALEQGAAKVVLLGFDLGFWDNRKHWHGDHPAGLENCASIADWPRQFDLLAKDAAKRGVPIVNASRRTNLMCFPRVALEAALRGTES